MAKKSSDVSGATSDPVRLFDSQQQQEVLSIEAEEMDDGSDQANESYHAYETAGSYPTNQMAALLHYSDDQMDFDDAGGESEFFGDIKEASNKVNLADS